MREDGTRQDYFSVTRSNEEIQRLWDWARRSSPGRREGERPYEEGVLDFAARLAAQPGTVDFAAPDGRTESLSMEERYFRELEARPVDGRASDFSASPSHTGVQSANINPAELTAKL